LFLPRGSVAGAGGLDDMIGCATGGRPAPPAILPPKAVASAWARAAS